MSHEVARPRLFTLVVHEGSGSGRAGRELPKVARYLRDHLPTVEVQIIRPDSHAQAEDACRAAALTCREGDALIVMGGDGMAHLGLNACARTDATLGIIPAGTGNDFARAVGVPTSIREAVAVIARGRTRTLDLARLSTTTYAERYVGAVVSSGYDAVVGRATNASRLRFGPLSYGWIALRELNDFSPIDYRLTVDGVVSERECMLVAVCNTGVFGGGMRIAPGADPADGLLDLTIVGPVGRATLLRLLPSIYTGGFVKHPAVEQVRASEVRIEGDGLFVMGDGEELGDAPVSVSAAPGALRLFVGD